MAVVFPYLQTIDGSDVSALAFKYTDVNHSSCGFSQHEFSLSYHASVDVRPYDVIAWFVTGNGLYIQWKESRGDQAWCAELADDSTPLKNSLPHSRR